MSRCVGATAQPTPGLPDAPRLTSLSLRMQFSFNNVSADDTIEFAVYDHNRLLKDAHMGEGSISLRQVGAMHCCPW